MKKLFSALAALALLATPVAASHQKLQMGVENTYAWWKCTRREPVELILELIKKHGAQKTMVVFLEFAKQGVCIVPEIETPMKLTKLLTQGKDATSDLLYSVVQIETKNGTQYWAITGDTVVDEDI